MFDSREPIQFVACMRELRPFLKAYSATELYRWTWLSNDDIRTVNNADRVSVRTAKRKTQSWTDRYKIAEEFGEDIGINSGEIPKDYSICILSAMIPANNILVEHKDLMDLLLRLERIGDNTTKEPSTNIDNGYNVSKKLMNLREELEIFEPQREWVIYLEDTIRVEDIKLRIPEEEEEEDSYYGKAKYESIMAASDPKHVTIVIDDPDSGKSHIEILGQGEATPDNIVPFKREEPKQHAASFKSRLLQ